MSQTVLKSSCSKLHRRTKRFLDFPVFYISCASSFDQPRHLSTSYHQTARQSNVETPEAGQHELLPTSHRSFALLLADGHEANFCDSLYAAFGMKRRLRPTARRRRSLPTVSRRRPSRRRETPHWDESSASAVTSARELAAGHPLTEAGLATVSAPTVQSSTLTTVAASKSASTGVRDSLLLAL